MADDRPPRRSAAQPRARSARASSSPTKMDKTVVVAVVDRVRHRRYGKTVQRTKQALRPRRGQRRSTTATASASPETRPLSKLKRWRVVEVLERAR